MKSEVSEDDMGNVCTVPKLISYFHQVPESSSSKSSARNATSKRRIKQIALGEAHTLMLDDLGQVYSCGWGDLGQLGISKSTNLDHF